MSRHWPLPTPSVGALLLAAGGLFLFFAATNVQSGWLFALDALLWTILLWDLLAASRPWPKVDVQRHAPPLVAAGAPLHLIVSLRADGPLRHVEVAEAGLVHQASGRQDRRLSYGYLRDLPAGESTSLARSMVIDARGHYRFGDLELIRYGPLGLFRRRRQIAVPGDLRVHPPVMTWPETATLLSSDGHQEGASRRLGPIGLFAGVRDYRPGDSLRQIHWPLTARRDVLSVKELEPPPARKLTLVLHLTGDGPDSEGAVTTATALAAWAWEHRLPLVLIGPGRCWEPGHWHEALAWFADVHAGPLPALPEDLGTVIMIADEGPPPAWAHPVAAVYSPVDFSLAGLSSRPFPISVKPTLSG